MTKKEEYAELLKNPAWKTKRLRILKRDKFTCTQCGAGREGMLQVHHTWYPQGAKPWQVDDKYLVTLCRKCHEGEHNLHPISHFYKKPDEPKKKKKKKPKIRISKPPKKKMTRKDKKIQAYYNKLRKEGKIP